MKQDEKTYDSIGLAGHILPVAATMVGVCMTVISVVQIIPKTSVSSFADALLALDNLLFLCSAMLSYYSIRHPNRMPQAERRADLLFLFGLSIMVVVGFIVAFDMFRD